MGKLTALHGNPGEDEYLGTPVASSLLSLSFFVFSFDVLCSLEVCFRLRADV